MVLLSQFIKLRCMITKTQLRDYKDNNIDALYASLRSCSTSLEARAILENLGRLPRDFDGMLASSYSVLDDAILALS